MPMCRIPGFQHLSERYKVDYYGLRGRAFTSPKELLCCFSASDGMRVSRAKQIRKHLRFYRIVYGIVAPYSILLDGNFIYAALKVKMDIKDRLKKLFVGEEVACFVVSAVLNELAALGPDFKAALDWAKACCEVVDSTRDTAADAIRSLVGENNDGKYVVATQDQDLKSSLRAVPCVPIVFTSRAILLMEPPSEAARATSSKIEGDKFRRLQDEEKELVQRVRAEEKERRWKEAVEAAPKIRLKKKAKGPNPLSVKKGKKGEHGATGADGKAKKKRKRKKSKGTSSEAT